MMVLIAAALVIFTNFAAPTEAKAEQIKRFQGLDAASIETILAADVVIIGEVHPNLEHRENQAALVAAIKPSAIVFEMIEQGQGAAFAAGHSGADRDGFLEEIETGAFGWKSLGEYLEILDEAPGATVMGAASPREILRQTVTKGAAEVFGEDAARYGLAEPLPEDQQKARETLQMEAHCNALPQEMLGGMVEAQRFRDAAFAKRIVEAMDETGGPVVMITGNGHAREDWGIPAALRRGAPELKVISIGQFEKTDEAAPFAIHIETAPFDEGDPCAAFTKP